MCIIPETITVQLKTADKDLLLVYWYPLEEKLSTVMPSSLTSTLIVKFWDRDTSWNV